MSKEELIAAGCQGKHKHTRKIAQDIARRQRKKGQKIEAYRCSVCHSWHIGEPNPAIADAQKWRPRPDKDRPTPERKAKGEWVWTTSGGGKAARDLTAHPIDRLEHARVISNDQASAGREFERLVHLATETPGIRDSCTLWEPQGHQSDDGNVEAVKRHKAMCRFLGQIRDQQLRNVCVYHVYPKPKEEGPLREALNEAARFFGYGRK